MTGTTTSTSMTGLEFGAAELNDLGFGIQPLPERLDPAELNAWAAKAKKGNSWAKTVCIRAVTPKVRSLLRKYHGVADAEGIAWERAEQTIRAWTPGENLASMVATRVENVLRDALDSVNAKKRTHEREAASVEELTEAGHNPAVVPSPALAAEVAWRNDLVEAALQTLTRVEREVTEWLGGFDHVPGYEDEKPTLERVALAMGVSPTTVRDIRDRARAKLRLALANHREDLLAV